MTFFLSKMWTWEKKKLKIFKRDAWMWTWEIKEDSDGFGPKRFHLNLKKKKKKKTDLIIDVKFPLLNNSCVFSAFQILTACMWLARAPK